MESLLREGTDHQVIIGEIKDRGISFLLNDDLVARFGRLGASRRLIQALKQSHQPNLSLKKVSILVADFKPVGAAIRPVTETLIVQLRDAIKEYSDIEVRALGFAITAQEGSDVAKAKGKELGADIVIWGFYTMEKERVLVNVFFEVLQAPRNLSLIEDKKTLPMPLSVFEGFNIQVQTPLSSEMAYLSLLTLGFARLEAEDFDGAISALTKTLTLPSAPDTLVDPIDVYFGRAVAHLAKSFISLEDEFDLAISDLNRVLALDPKNSDAYLQLANIYLQTGEFDKALSNCTRAVDMAPTDARPLVQRGQVYLRRGELGLASRDFKSALNHLSREKEMNQSSKLFLSSQIHLFTENFPQALSDINELLKLERDDRARPFLLLFKTLVYWWDDEYEKTVDEATEALRLKPDLFFLYFLRADAHANLENYSEAMDDVNHLLNLRPHSVLGYLERADILRHKGDAELSLRDYRQALILDPGLGSAYVGRGRSYTIMKQYDKALEDFDRAIKAKKSDLTAYLYRGFAFRLKGDMGQAISNYDQYVKVSPEDEDGYSFRAAAHEAMGETDNAINDYAKAIQVNPNDAEMFFKRAQLLRKKGEHDQALSDYRRALEVNPSFSQVYLSRGLTYILKGSSDRAIDDFTKFISLRPSDPNGYYVRAVLYKEKGQLDKALADYSRAIDLDPNSTDSYIGRADILYGKHATDEAISDYSKVIQLKPTAASYRERGFAYVDNRNWVAAIADFEASLKLDPANVRLLLAIGLCYQSKRDFDKAVAVFSNYISVKPTDSNAFKFRGNAYRSQQKWTQAREDYDAAIALNPNESILYRSRGFVLEKNGFREEAIKDYSEALKLNSRDPETFFSRASLYFNNRNFTAAIEDLDTAIVLNRQVPTYFWLRALSKHHIRDYDGAITDFGTALNLNPNWDRALLDRGIVYAAKGDFSLARLDIRKAVRLTTSAELKRQAEAQLMKIKKSMRIQPRSGFIQKLLIPSNNGSFDNYVRS